METIFILAFPFISMITLKGVYRITEGNKNSWQFYRIAILITCAVLFWQSEENPGPAEIMKWSYAIIFVANLFLIIAALFHKNEQKEPDEEI